MTTTERPRLLGAANAITAVRALAASVCLGTIVTSEVRRGGLSRVAGGSGSRAPALASGHTRRDWYLTAIAGPALLLDSVDGFVARRTGTESEWGARFDMEVDAAAFLVLSWAVARRTRWAWGIGAARYVFWCGGRLRSAWQAPLQRSRRRRVIAALQGAALWVALVPATPDPVARGVLRTSLLLLAYSFGRDIAGLERCRMHAERALPAEAQAQAEQAEPAEARPASAQRVGGGESGLPVGAGAQIRSGAPG